MTVEAFLFCAAVSVILSVAFWARNYALARSLMLLALIPLLCLVRSYFIVQTFLLYLGLIISFEIAHWFQVRPRYFSIWCAASMLLMFGGMMVLYIPQYQEHQRLVARYPVIPIARRLSYEGDATGRLPGQTALQGGEVAHDPVVLFFLEEELKSQLGNYRTDSHNRSRALRALSQVHANFIVDFINQPGFGVARLPTRRPLRESQLPFRDSSPIPQSAVPAQLAENGPESPIADLELGNTPVPVEDRKPTYEEGPGDFAGFNIRQISDFARMETLGFVSAERDARGFQPHAFGTRPSDLKRSGDDFAWQLTKLELVSILKHQPAAAYVSANLPTMEELKDAPTRALDEFEMSSTRRLREGEELVVEARHNELRMVGAIRAAEQCLSCHQVPKAGLLGAFTYRFQRNPLLPANQNKVKTAGRF